MLLGLCLGAVCSWALRGEAIMVPHDELQGKEPRIDYADSKQVDDWLRHPVYGDPSFDSFKRCSNNPIYRGTPEYEWPVNGSLFLDPRSHNWYVFIGDYKAGYVAGHSRVHLLRSKDRGKTWDDLGPQVQASPDMFDKNGHTPDATVVYDGGRYHMVYDWVQPPFGPDGGLAYAWADRPEGPWHRAPEAITHNETLGKLLGRYSRTYAGTLIRRRNDWLIVAMLDYAPYGWALFAMTARHAAGPYSERKLVRHVEGSYFYPPLMEYFPAFEHGGFVYASATSVALNRNFQIVCRAPIERAEDPSAWEIYRYGSAWHSEDVENEAAGIWGQTFSGQVTKDGVLLAMFTSRDPHNFGTVNMAERAWDEPLRKRGFHFSGHAGPSFTCVDRAYRAFVCRADLRVRGTARIVWDYHGALGPDRPTSDATLHALTTTRYSSLELSDGGWRVITVDAAGIDRVLAEGGPGRRSWNVAVRRTGDGEVHVSVSGKVVWSGQPEARPVVPALALTATPLPPPAGGEGNSVVATSHSARSRLKSGPWAQTHPGDDSPATDEPGPLGLYAAPDTHVEASRFEVEGQSVPAHLSYLYTEGLVGAGEPQDDWEEQHGPEFRFGVGAVHRGPGGRAKWNFYGTGVRLWSPTGPQLGKVSVSVDGGRATVVDLRSEAPCGPVAVFERLKLKPGPHCLIVMGVEGVAAVDGVEVVASCS